MKKNKTAETALITGASAGLGEEFAKQLSKEGTNLILVARRKERLESLAKSLTKQHGIKAHVFCADLSSADGVKKVAAHVKKENGVVDLLVNNAGFGTYGELVHCDTEKELQMVDLHCRTMVQLLHEFLPPMLERKTGGMIHVASAAAFMPVPYMATYAATKAFMLHLSDAVAHEVKSYGVHMMALCPGATKTEFQEVANVNTSFQSPRFMTAEAVVAQALRDYKKRNTVSVPGIENLALYYLARVAPKGPALSIAAALTKPKN